MQRPQLSKLLGALAALLMFTALARHQARAEGQVAIAVIVAKDFAAHDISIALLRRAFGGDVAEAGGKRLIPFNYEAGDRVRRAFDLAVLKMASEDVGRYWVDRRIRGQGYPPRTVPSVQLMKGVVAKVSGAIGYIPANQVDATVQVLSVDGATIADSGYPLKGL